MLFVFDFRIIENVMMWIFCRCVLLANSALSNLSNLLDLLIYDINRPTACFRLNVDSFNGVVYYKGCFVQFSRVCKAGLNVS